MKESLIGRNEVLRLTIIAFVGQCDRRLKLRSSLQATFLHQGEFSDGEDKTKLRHKPQFDLYNLRLKLHDDPH